MSRYYGNSADYVRRTFDLLALQGASPTQARLLTPTLFSEADAGEVCTGVQKLAQRWLLHFLTGRGSMPFRPDDGTDFVRQAQRGVWQSEIDIFTAFDFAATETALYMQQEETEDMHPEDRFKSAELLAVTLRPNRTAALSVRITSLAGADRQILLPIPLSPITTGL